MLGVPNIVKQRLQATARPRVHPDPDLLAAFVERSLTQPEQNNILRHLAECAECREVMALAVPEQIDVTETIRVRPSWFSWPVLRWGAVVACVVVVGAAISLHYESLTARHQGSLPTGDVAAVKTDSTVESSNIPSSMTIPQREIDVPSEASTSTMSSAKSKPSTSHEARNVSGAGKLQQLKQQGSQPGSTPLSASAQPPVESALNIPGRAKDEDGPTAEGKLETAPSAGTNSLQTLASSAMMARAAAVPANATPRWTLTADGILQRSIDSGKTWETILVASPGIFRALTANGFDIWVGGAKGSLYHSVDAGQHWMQSQPVADGTVLTADITVIEFDDPLNGTLTTADGQIWTTADAGRNWTRQQ